ncbi:MAG: methyltransferase domain-containing protein [Candidatus Micrarchaeaceae archaeon]
MKRVLASKFVWRLSGLSYRTAVIATRGSYLSREKYLDQSKNQMQQLLKYFNISDRVLEFGCGIGGNLLAIADTIKEGVGIDINPLFIWQANKLKNLTGKKNIYFIYYTGKIFPMLGKFNSIFSIGVFERISKDDIIYYLTNLKNYLTEDGIMMIYFLTERAKKTAFIKILGEDAYVYCSQDDVKVMAKQLNLEIVDSFPWRPSETEESVSDMYIFQKTPI